MSKNKNNVVQLTKRNLDFRRDSSLQLVDKLYNQKYIHHRNEILNEISLKYFTINTKKEKLDKIHSIYLNELSKDSFYKMFV